LLATIGDLARIFQSRQLTTGIKADISRLSEELTTGVRTDPIGSAVGDFGPRARMERLLTTLGARKTATSEAAFLTEVMQTTLDSVQENTRATGQSLLALTGNEYVALINVKASAARQGFDQVISALNSNAAGRTMFGGAATDRAALASADEILAALVSAVAAETTPAGVAQAVDDWFDTPGGGFETVAYLGSTAPMGAFQIGESDVVKPDIRADDPALRGVMKSFAMAALVTEGILAGTSDGPAGLLQIASERLVAADQSLTELRAGLGEMQEKIETATATNSAMETTIKLSRNDLIAVDPYETASRLEASYSQLETYYTLTARLSRLNFTDFLR